MTVVELIEKLKKSPSDAKVCVYEGEVTGIVIKASPHLKDWQIIEVESS